MLALDHLFSHLLIDGRKLSGTFDDAPLKFIVQPINLRFCLLQLRSFHHLPASISAGDGKLVSAGHVENFRSRASRQRISA